MSSKENQTSFQRESFSLINNLAGFGRFKGGGLSTEVECSLLTQKPRVRIWTLARFYEMDFQAQCSKDRRCLVQRTAPNLISFELEEIVLV